MMDPMRALEKILELIINSEDDSRDQVRDILSVVKPFADAGFISLKKKEED